MLPLIAIRPQAFFMIPDWRWPLARIPVAMVWLYEGLWSKVLNGHPDHLEIAQRFPGLSGSGAVGAVLLVGSVECLLALWVLWGVRPRQAAIAQTSLLTAMNAAGLLWAAAEIPHPGQMLVMNLAFLTLVWIVAEHGSGDGKGEEAPRRPGDGSALRLPRESKPAKASAQLEAAPESPLQARPLALASLGCADAAEYLEACLPGTFGGFHLSNILDGASDSYRSRLMQAVRRAAAPGARLVLRSFAEPKDPREELWAGLDRSLLWGAVRVEELGSESRPTDLEACGTRLWSQLQALKGDQ